MLSLISLNPVKQNPKTQLDINLIIFTANGPVLFNWDTYCYKKPNYFLISL